MRIGYYAHHHGSGHCRQADKLAALLLDEAREQFIVFTSLNVDTYRFTAIDETQIVRLHAEDERTDDVLAGRAGEYWQPASLHYSPIGNTDIQKRSHQILDTIFQRKIDLMIIDVSVEVAMLCRAASIPYLYVRLPGNRDDIPHISAFAGALALLAPYPQELESSHTSGWVSQKTLYLDFIYSHNTKLSTYDDFIETLVRLKNDNADVISKNLLHESTSSTHQSIGVPIVTVLKGYGGHKTIDEKLPELRALLPNAFIISLGPIEQDKRRYVDIAAHADDVTPFICHSDYLVMACGLNAIAQAYHYDTPLIVVPDDRPHNEQDVMAQALVTQARALDWQQFCALTTSQDNQYKLAEQAQDKQRDTVPMSSNIEERAASMSTAAQSFMHSTTAYPTTKLWFEKWLLPRIKLKPENA